MSNQLKSPSEFAMELVIHIIGTVATVAGCANPELSHWGFFSCIFHMLGTGVALLGDILEGFDRIRKHDLSLIQLSYMDRSTALFFMDLMPGTSMEEEMTKVSSLCEDIFDDPWIKADSRVDPIKFAQGLELLKNSLLGPIHKNKEGYICIGLELHSLSGLDIFKGWKREVCFNDTVGDYSNVHHVSSQPIDGYTDRGLAFTYWLKRYGVSSLPWSNFFGKGSFHALTNLWDETRLIMKGGNTVDDSRHTWNITDSGNNLITISLWKDPSDIM